LLGPDLIRYYDSIGLLDRSPRTEGSHRVYGVDDARRLTFFPSAGAVHRGSTRSRRSNSTIRRRSCALSRQSRMRYFDLLDQCRRTTIVECCVIDTLSSVEV